MKNIKVIAGILLIFALGATAGILVTQMVYETRLDALVGGDARARDAVILNRLSRQLDLDDAQKQQIQTIVREIRQDVAGIRKPLAPRIEAALVQGRERISQVLRPDQREKYQEILARKKRQVSQN